MNQALILQKWQIVISFPKPGKNQNEKNHIITYPIKIQPPFSILHLEKEHDISMLELLFTRWIF